MPSPKRPTVAIGNITNGIWRTEFGMSLIEAVDNRVIDSYYVNPGNLYLDTSRNVVCEEFLKSNIENLLFVDSDIQFSMNDILNILKHASADRLISGVYRSLYPEGKRPVAGRWKWSEKFQCNSIQPIEEHVLEEDVSDEGLVKVDGVGAGFLLIHRHILERMLEIYKFPMPWFITMVIDGSERGGRGHQWYGEDYTFCLRAESMGVSTFVAPEVDLAHIKTYPVTKDS